MNIIRLNSIGEPFAKSGQATPPSGGGTEASSMEYLDVSGITWNTTLLKNYASLIKWEQEDGTVVIESGTAYYIMGRPVAKALGIDFTTLLSSSTDGERTIMETLILLGFTEDQLAAIPRLTKEQFYTL